VAVIELMQGFIQLPKELVIAYANPLKVNSRQAVWNLQQHEEVLYNIAWAGQHNSLNNQFGPMTAAIGRFDTLNKFLDKAAALDVTHVENNKPRQEQQQQQQQ
jgi:hypothetical protein